MNVINYMSVTLIRMFIAVSLIIFKKLDLNTPCSYHCLAITLIAYIMTQFTIISYKKLLM